MIFKIMPGQLLSINYMQVSDYLIKDVCSSLEPYAASGYHSQALFQPLNPFFKETGFPNHHPIFFAHPIQLNISSVFNKPLHF
jgi:hypothetical protein